MTNQEREQLTELLQQLTQARLAQKDGEADNLIRDACSRQPDAAYLLALKVMLMDHALQNSQAQIAQLQGELEQARNQTGGPTGGSGSFLDPNAWGNSAVSRSGPPPQAPQYPTNPASTLAPAPAPVAAPAVSSWGGGSMLGNIATTAAGVVAGSFLFQRIEHLLGNRNPNSGLMNGLSGNGSIEPGERRAIHAPADDGLADNDIFDTSSVDDFIASDTDNTT